MLVKSVSLLVPQPAKADTKATAQTVQTTEFRLELKIIANPRRSSVRKRVASRGVPVIVQKSGLASALFYCEGLECCSIHFQS
jgi:hypothetical protein